MGRIRPFDESGIRRGRDGVLRYDHQATSLVDMFRQTVERCPESEAVFELGSERLNYVTLWERASRVAGGLRDSGLHSGDRVALKMQNGTSWVVAFFGIQLAGCIAVPLNLRLAPPEVDYILRDSESALLLDSPDRVPIGHPYADETITPTSPAAIFYTSGTTGLPKGAVTTHGNFLANNENCRRILHLDGECRTLVSAPLFHVIGCNFQLLAATERGGATVIMPSFEARTYIRALVEERITHAAGVPAIYWLVANQPEVSRYDFRSLREVTYGGAPTPPHVIRRLREVFPAARLGNGFGLTETSSVCTLLPDAYCDSRPESVGFAVPSVELNIFEPDPNGRGELVIRGPNVVSGYWRKPKETAEVFSDGWFRTGDMAFIDEDGFCQIVDRKKDMINRGGENVYSVEVENVLMDHEAVFECAVVGVPDEVMGEKVGAVVVAYPEQSLDANELVAFARQRLASFKVPQYILITKECLPRNAGGKVLKRPLRETAQWGISALVEQPARPCGWVRHST